QRRILFEREWLAIGKTAGQRLRADAAVGVPRRRRPALNRGNRTVAWRQRDWSRRLPDNRRRQSDDENRRHAADGVHGHSRSPGVWLGDVRRLPHGRDYIPRSLREERR